MSDASLPFSRSAAKHRRSRTRLNNPAEGGQTLPFSPVIRAFLQSRFALGVRTAIAILALYLELPFMARPGLPVPHVLGFVLALLLLPDLTKKRLGWLTGVVALAAFFGAFNLLTTAFGSVPLTEKLKSFILFVYVFGIAAVIVHARFIRPEQRAFASKLFLGAGLALLVFSALEPRTPLRQVSDEFRIVAFGKLSYANDSRDEKLLGIVRPKAFTNEPSFAARGVSVLLLLGAMLSRSAAVRAGAVVVIGASVLVFGSPIPAGFAVCLAFGVFIPQWIIRRRWTVPFYAVIAVGCAAALVLAVLTVPPLRTRFELLRDNQDPSAYRRTTFMREMAVKALRLNPVSGVGLGGAEELDSDFLLPTLEQQPATNLINNAFWSIPFFTGLLGFALFFVLFFLLLRRLPPHHWAIFALTTMAMLSVTGAINSTSAWLTCAVLYRVLRGEEEEAALLANTENSSAA